MHEHSDKDHLLYLVVVGIGFICAVGLLVGVNIWVDPANILGSEKQEQRMAQLVEEGLNISGRSDFNDRLFQLFRIRLMDQAPDNIVIGSSRALQIRDGMLPGRTVNNAVPGASLEDYFAILQLYGERNMLPKHIVLVADGWLFNIANQQSRWVALRNKCNALAEHLGVIGLCSPGAGGLDGQSLRELLSYGYLRESLKRLARHGVAATSQNSTVPDASIIGVKELPLVQGGRLADGSILYPKKQRTTPHTEIERAAAQFAKATPVYSLGGYHQLDPIYTNGFEALVEYLTAKGVQVSIVLVPYHPVATQIFREDRIYASRLNDAEGFVRSTAKRYGASVFGGYLSDVCEVKEFYDGQHPRQSCMAKLLGVYVPDVYLVVDSNLQH